MAGPPTKIGGVSSLFSWSHQEASFADVLRALKSSCSDVQSFGKLKGLFNNFAAGNNFVQASNSVLAPEYKEIETLVSEIEKIQPNGEEYFTNGALLSTQKFNEISKNLNQVAELFSDREVKIAEVKIKVDSVKYQLFQLSSQTASDGEKKGIDKSLMGTISGLIQNIEFLWKSLERIAQLEKSHKAALKEFDAKRDTMQNEYFNKKESLIVEEEKELEVQTRREYQEVESDLQKFEEKIKRTHEKNY